MVSPVMFSLRETISGQSSTTTRNDLACTNGIFPNAGFSAIERSLAETPPEKSASCRSPSFTSRPSDWVNVDSRVGRNWLASIRVASATTAATTTITLTAAIRIVFFIVFASANVPF
jgi:hypothetical protein